MILLLMHSDDLGAHAHGAQKLPEAKLWVFHVTIQRLHELLPRFRQHARARNAQQGMQKPTRIFLDLGALQKITEDVNLRPVGLLQRPHCEVVRIERHLHLARRESS